MTPAPIGTGMYIHFDPNKIVLPPIFGGPGLQNQSLPATLKRKREWENQACSSAFSNFEDAYKRATDNEQSLVEKRLGLASPKKRVKRVNRANHDAARNTPLLSFDGKNGLIEALRECFKQSHDVDFAGTYRLYDPGVSHRQRIQSMTHEIWKTTGYRFTVKDHPRTKSGHKTRLWCSQDEAHRSKSSKSSIKPRTSTEGAALAKIRYPCRSGLLISSREDNGPDIYLITVRMHHHVSHEPYYDATLPPEITQSIWETMGWRKNSSPSPVMDAGEEASADSGSEEDPSSDGEFPDPLQISGGESPEAALEVHPEAPLLDPEMYQKRMRRHIAMIRDFCDGLEYQLPFNDYRMLEVLESEGAKFLRLVEDCLKKEGRIKAEKEGSLEMSKKDGGDVAKAREGRSIEASRKNDEGPPKVSTDRPCGANEDIGCSPVATMGWPRECNKAYQLGALVEGLSPT